MDYARLQHAASERDLRILGAFHPGPDDGAPDGTRTLLLLGPAEPAFWPRVQASQEWQDGAPDPIDRWSHRVITAWAEEIGARALFPFGGPPYQPFFSWATRTGRIHASPIRLLVQDEVGLFVSFRGALALEERIDLPEAPSSPCLSCQMQPCRHVCPVGAFDGESYDVPACKYHIAGPDDLGCLTKGCGARRACPVSQSAGRLPAQSAYHMQRFLGA